MHEPSACDPVTFDDLSDLPFRPGKPFREDLVKGPWHGSMHRMGTPTTEVSIGWYDADGVRHEQSRTVPLGDDDGAQIAAAWAELDREFQPPEHSIPPPVEVPGKPFRILEHMEADGRCKETKARRKDKNAPPAFIWGRIGDDENAS